MKPRTLSVRVRPSSQLLSLLALCGNCVTYDNHPLQDALERRNEITKSIKLLCRDSDLLVLIGYKKSSSIVMNALGDVIKKERFVVVDITNCANMDAIKSNILKKIL